MITARMNGESIAMCFSGGKDSALALSEIVRARTYSVDVLLTTVTGEYDRVSMHGVRRPQHAADASPGTAAGGRP